MMIMLQSLVVVVVVALWCVVAQSSAGQSGHSDWQYGNQAPRHKNDGSISYNGGSQIWYTSSPGISYRDYNNAMSASGPSTYYKIGGGATDKNMFNILNERSGNALPDRQYYSRFENGYQDQLRSRFTGMGNSYGAGYRQAGFYGSKSPPSGYDSVIPQAYRGSRIYDGIKTINFSPPKKTGVYVIPTPAKLYYDGVKN